MMIEVNFLPAEEKKKKALPKIPPGLPLKIFGLVLAVLVVTHLIIISAIYAERFYLNRLKAQVSQRMPKSAEAALMRQEIAKLEEKQSVMNALFGKRIAWSEKLNIISDEIPTGIWLNRIMVTTKLFSMDGTAVSLKGEEMKMISSLLDVLKKKENFYSDFEDLALKSIQRRWIKSIEVVDFIIAGFLKEE